MLRRCANKTCTVHAEPVLDPHLLMWDIQRTVRVDEWPRTRTTLAVRLSDADGRPAFWWIVASGDSIEICDFDPATRSSRR